VIGFQNRVSLEQLSKRLLLEESKKGKVPVHPMKAYGGGGGGGAEKRQK